MSKLKRLILLFFTGVIMTTMISCKTPPIEDEPTKQTLLPRQVGDFLPITPLDDAYAAICNGLGMSGAQGRNHHHNNVSSSMYKGEKTDFIFDIGHIDKLGEMHIWNYNEENNTECGLKQIAVSYSVDNINYVDLGSFELKQASGEQKSLADNLTNGKFIDFNAASARYIKISPQTNYGTTEYGLAEIRLYRYKQDVFEGANISASPVEWYKNNELSVDPLLYNMTNGVGLSHPTSESATASNEPQFMYNASKAVLGFTFDMKGYYPIAKMNIYNYNDPDNLDYGLKNFKIEISDDGMDFREVKNTPTTLPKGTGVDNAAASLTISFEPQIRGRFVRILNEGNYGGSRTGLSAVTFYTGSGWFSDNAPDLTALFSNYSGWSGADGVFSTNLDGKDYDAQRLDKDKKTFFIFSDTLDSVVNPVSDIRTQVNVVNNSSAIVSGGGKSSLDVKFVLPKNNKKALVMPNPATPTSFGGNLMYYWMGDVFVLGDKLYAYAYKIDNVDPATNGFSFAEEGTDLARFDIVDGEVDYDSVTMINDTTSANRKLSVPQGQNNRFYFGSAVFENTQQAGAINPDGYIYVYGYYDKTGGGRNLVVARFLPEDVENFDKYRFLSSSGQWIDNMNDPKLLIRGVAPEISVSQIRTGENRGKLQVVFSQETISPNIRMAIADDFTSEFTNPFTVFYHDTQKAIIGSGNTTYNAKAHPALSNERELYISYHINGNNWSTYGDVYRPRFIRYALIPQIN